MPRISVSVSCLNLRSDVHSSSGGSLKGSDLSLSSSLRSLVIASTSYAEIRGPDLGWVGLGAYYTTGPL